MFLNHKKSHHKHCFKNASQNRDVGAILVYTAIQTNCKLQKEGRGGSRIFF